VAEVAAILVTVGAIMVIAGQSIFLGVFQLSSAFALSQDSRLVPLRDVGIKQFEVAYRFAIEGKSDPENPVLIPAFVRRLLLILKVVRLLAVAPRDTCALNDINLFPERLREVSPVMPVPMKVVSLLFMTLREVSPVLLATLRVVKLGMYVVVMSMTLFSTMRLLLISIVASEGDHAQDDP
jgi:hypothetical protein